MTNRHFQSAIGVPSGPPQSAIRATRAYALLLIGGFAALGLYFLIVSS